MTESGQVANGLYDLQVCLYDNLVNPVELICAADANDVPVESGLFAVSIDFGAGAFAGQERYLELRVRPGASTGAYTALSPRQLVRAAPEAQHAAVANVAPWAGISGIPAGFADGVDADGRLPASFQVGEAEVDGALRELGIDYRAPADARRTGLTSGEVDCVTSSLTLEHIPLPEIRAIFAELFRVLRPGGLLASKVDMGDHFSHSDPSISPWHFLRFDERTWGLVNADMLYQYRLRASAYRDAAREAGFELVEVDRRYPRGCDPDTVELPEVHPSYTSYLD